jgi:hypothetical protein
MGGQHFNGQAERKIGILKKKHPDRSLEGKRYSHEETCTILQEAAQIVSAWRTSC